MATLAQLELPVTNGTSVTNQTFDLEDEKAYRTEDTASTDLADGDYIPFYDTSATAKRKTLWSNIKSVLKTYFDTLYGSLSSVTAIEGKIPSGASSSNKMATASDVTTITNGVIANTKLIKDTVGWSGKNKWVTDLFTTKTAVGYTATVDPITKKIHITGTHDTETAGVIECGLIHLEAGTYKLSGGIGGISQKLGLQVWASSAYSDQWYSFDNSEVTMILATAKDCKLRIWFSGVTSNVDVTFEPMIRSADILDSTYEPYFGSTAFPRSEQAVLGAKNRYDFYINSTEGGTGITSSISNGVLSLSGTASGAVYVVISDKTLKNQFAGMKLTDGGEIPSALNNKVNLRVRIETDGGSFVRSEVVPTNGSITIPTLEANQRYRIDILIADTANLGSGVTIKPMISFDGGEFAPYAMTNRELTEKKIDKSAILLNASNDLDDIKNENQVGYYRWESAYPVNSPENRTWSIMQMMYYGGGVKQIVYYGADNMYIRQYVSGTWSSWYKFTGTEVS